MKILRIFLITVICSLAAAAPVEAQKNDRQLRRSIKKRAVKDARKEGRRLKRQKFYVAPGAIPLSKQVQDAWMRQYQVTENGEPLYIIASGNAVANTQTAAKLQATQVAKLELGGLVSTQISAIIESNIANEQLNQFEANSVTKTVAAAKNTVSTQLGRTLQILEIYRKQKKNNLIESTVRLAYNSEQALEIARNSIIEKLEAETNIARDKLERLMEKNSGGI